jgi:hypothetical protein
MARSMKLHCAMRQALLLSVALAGCMGAQPDQGTVRAFETGSGDDVEVGFALPWDPEQGTHILGFDADAITGEGAPYLQISTTPVNFPDFTLSVTDSDHGMNLVAKGFKTPTYTGAASWFNGLVLAASNGGQLTITASRAIDPSEVGVKGVQSPATSTVYAVSYSAPLGGGRFAEPVDYCGGAGGAIFIAGAYTARRAHVNTNAITVACPTGIVFKCAFWGYNPGTGGPTTDAWKFHQSCVVMGGARYCGAGGKSYTRELTPIEIRDGKINYGVDWANDFGHPNPFPGDPDRMYIEAGWNENGPICLSKIRWAALEPDACAGQSGLVDPRFHYDPEHAFFCDDYSISQLITLKHALIVNGSETMDFVMHRWKNPDTGDVVSTGRGFFIDRNPRDGAPDTDSTLPFAGMGPGNYRVYQGSEGMLLRHLPGSLDEQDMRPLAMQTSGNDRYLGDAVGGKADPNFEGYSFLSQNTTTVPEGLPVNNLQPFSRCTTAAGRDTRLVAAKSCNAGVDLSYALPSP